MTWMFPSFAFTHIAPWAQRNAHLLASMLMLWLAVAAALFDPLRVAGVRENLFDFYQMLKPRQADTGAVRIVDIDEESLARIGQWPWPRSRLAELLQAIYAQQPAAVVLDILLPEADRASPVRLLPYCRNSSDQPRRERVPGRACADYDAMLAAAIAGGRVVTGFALVEVSGMSLPAIKAGFSYIDGDAPTLLPALPQTVNTLPLLEAAATGNGALNVSLSAGGVIRHVPLLLQAGPTIVPSLVAESLRVAQAADTYEVKLSPADGAVLAVRIGAYTIPTDSAGRILLYATPPVKSRYLPAWTLLAGEPPTAALHGKIVLVGSTARGLQDVHRTPLGYDVPGVEFHAQALEQVVQEIYLRRPPWAPALEAALCLMLGALVLTTGGILGPMGTAVIGAGAVAAAFATSWIAFSGRGLVINPIYPALAALAVYLVFSLLRHWRSDRQQRWIRKAFASYVSPKLVNQLVEQPRALKLGGERRDLTFLFTDLEGFTPLVERQPPAVVVPTLNAYLDGMIRIAFAHDGTVDKIIGDAVHVMFGAPVADPAHADRAVACALDMDRFACDFAQVQREAGIPFGRTRIGVNTGSAIVGNFGGALRFDYTAHGDAINTAARLEGANKFVGTRICISEATTRRCTAFAGRPVATILLKGKSEPTRVWEPDSRGEGAPDATLRQDEKAPRDAYLRAFDLLETCDPAAEAAFAALHADWPHDALVTFHLRRLQAGATGCLVVLTEK